MTILPNLQSIFVGGKWYTPSALAGQEMEALVVALGQTIVSFNSHIRCPVVLAMLLKKQFTFTAANGNLDIEQPLLLFLTVPQPDC